MARALSRRYGHAGAGLTATQLAVLKLIAAGRELGDYVPEYRSGAQRGRGAFPVTIAARAAVQLRAKGLVVHTGSRWELTPEGRALEERERGHAHGLNDKREMQGIVTKIARKWATVRLDGTTTVTSVPRGDLRVGDRVTLIASTHGFVTYYGLKGAS